MDSEQFHQIAKLLGTTNLFLGIVIGIMVVWNAQDVLAGGFGPAAGRKGPVSGRSQAQRAIEDG